MRAALVDRPDRARDEREKDPDVTWICSHCGEKSSRFRQRCARDGHRIVEDLAGVVIAGRYRLKELIGVGGMDSAVWKAWQMGAERLVAVKILPPADDAAAKRFARGARIAANLSHPNCLVIHDYGTADDGKLYLVMELLNGKVLNDALPVEGMGVPETLHVADQVLQALEHAHEERAVHRDLKPDNLFLCQKNNDPYHVKILDFGIAKYIEEEYDEAGPVSGLKPAEGFEDLVTEQRQVCGTPQYMAPEQVVGARVDGRADLYALGCVLYRMLTGRLPFDGKTRYELYQKHLQEAPRPFSEVRPDLQFPERLELIVMKALAKRPAQRFQTAGEMREALATVPVDRPGQRRGARPRVALKDTSPQQAIAPTAVHDMDDLAHLGAAMSQVPLKPSFTVQPPPEEPEQPIGEEKTVVRGMQAWVSEEIEAASLPTAPVPPPAHPPSVPPPAPPPPVAAPTPIAPALAPVDPTMLPHGVWTLSRPVPASAARAEPVQSAVPGPTAAHPSLVRVVPVRPVTGVAPAASAPQLARVPTPPGGPSGTPAMPAPSPWQVSGVPPSASAHLGAAIIRHPATRGMLHAAGSLPHPSETEPSSVLLQHEKERPRWVVAAMLGGAFLLGVGGVSLGLHVLGGEDPGGEDPQTVAAAPSEKPRVDLPAGNDPAASRAGAPPTEPSPEAPQPAVAAAEEATLAGEPAEPAVAAAEEATLAGEPAEAAAPAGIDAPATVRTETELLIESEPAGAAVYEGERLIGPAPLSVRVQPGPHSFVLRRSGHADALISFVAEAEATEGPVVRRVQLEPLPEPARPTPAPRVESPRPSPRPAPRPDPEPPVTRVAPEPLKPTPVKPAPEPVRPTPEPTRPREVKLLEELEGPASPIPKPKPKVNLLDEGDAPAPKPKRQIKTLDEL